jgi:probable rRNA maturation factor
VLVDCVIEEPGWEAAGLETLAEAAARAALAELGLTPEGFLIVVMGCDDARIATLNADFRGKPKSTNVLSWPSEERGPETPGGTPDLPEPGDEEDPEELGDIAIALGVCRAEAAEQGKSFDSHVTHLIIHAVLHLMGYDHQTEEDATLMEGIEIRALASMGIENPY